MGLGAVRQTTNTPIAMVRLMRRGHVHPTVADRQVYHLEGDLKPIDASFTISVASSAPLGSEWLYEGFTDSSFIPIVIAVFKHKSKSVRKSSMGIRFLLYSLFKT